MAMSRNNGGNGRAIPGWFKTFLVEYRTDRDATGLALKTLAESMQHLTEKVRDLGGGMHRVEIQQERTNEERVRTRKQSANLIGRLIREVKALRPR